MSELDVRRFLGALAEMEIDSYFYDEKGMETLQSLRNQVMKCERCALSKTRKNIVFGEGNDAAALLFVGEAPGEEEDLQGRPFVGKAGKMLDRMIERIGLRRQEVYICNVLKCRPPHNRDPEITEVEACKDYLLRQIELIDPKVICTLGRHAYNALFDVDARITRIRGNVTEFMGRTLMPTYHPSFLLRNQARIDEAWGDMERLRELLQRRE